MANESPAFQFYPRDFLGDPAVMVMSTEEVGAYWLILCSAWHSDRPGYVPNDHDLLRKMARLDTRGWKRCCSAVLRALKTTDDGEWLFSKRMVEEQQKQLIRRHQASEAGSRSAKARAQRKANEKPTTVERPLNDRTNEKPTEGATKFNSASASASASANHVSFSRARNSGEWGASEFRRAWERVTHKSGMADPMVLRDAAAKIADSARVSGREDVGQYAVELIGAMPKVIESLKSAQLGAPALTIAAFVDDKHFSRCEDVVAGKLEHQTVRNDPPRSSHVRRDLNAYADEAMGKKIA